MKLKKQSGNKTELVRLRCCLTDKNALQRKANIYTDGNLSEYLLYVGLNFVAGQEDMEEEIKKDRE